MVLIAAAICTKGGKTLVARQFVEMTKSRIEGLLGAFPKLIPAGKQHTFVETDAVRYVYQPMEKLYMVLITTKASNILEDLETLRLFAKVVPEYCKNLEESDVCENAFNLIIAFDEIVALGYRENVNLAQIRTFVEMDSHEEKVYKAVLESQMKDAKKMAREKAKQFQRERLDASKRGIKSGGSSAYSMSSSNFNSSSGSSIVQDNTPSIPLEPRSSYAKPSSGGKALKLGGKTRDAESFVDQLKSEGERVAPTPTASNASSTKAGSQVSQSSMSSDPVNLKIEEKIQVTAGRNGGLQNMEVIGMVTLRIRDEDSALIRVQVENQDSRGIQFVTHPNVDKELFKNMNQISPKNLQKPFPVNTDVPVLKWRYQTKEESEIPLTINCWPSENGQGGCDVNIEYELQNEDLELLDVIISIPVPSGGPPVVSECEGDYLYEPRRNTLLWQLAVIDSSNKSGVLEFTVPNGTPGQFFPVQVTFTSLQSFARLAVSDVKLLDSGLSAKYSVETSLVAESEKYEIV